MNERKKEGKKRCVNYLLQTSPSGDNVPVRVFISSDNGVSVRTHMYREIEDPKTGEVHNILYTHVAWLVYLLLIDNI